MFYPDIRTKLKSHLKQRGITYAQLAEKMNMSASGIKKIFLAKDITLERLNEICSVLDLKLHEILDPDLDAREPETVVLTEKVQNYFMHNKSCFKFLILLYSEHRPLDEILEEFRIPKKRAYGYLKDLENLNLLKWLPGDRVSLDRNVVTLFKIEGPFMKSFMRELGHEILEDAISQYPGADVDFLAQRVLHLGTKSKEELKAALQDIIAEFNKRSLKERKRKTKGLSPIRLQIITKAGHLFKTI